MTVPNGQVSEQIEEVDVLGLSGQQLCVGLRGEHAASIEVEVHRILGGCGGDVERLAPASRAKGNTASKSFVPTPRPRYARLT